MYFLPPQESLRDAHVSPRISFEEYALCAIADAHKRICLWFVCCASVSYTWLMSFQILATKLYIPVLRPGSVLRPRLIDRLNVGLRGKLTLVSAPAGFGKTTLVTEWISSGDHATAWLSLDESDSDPVRFLAYLVAALETIAPQIGAGIMNPLGSPQPPPIDSRLTLLLNAIATIPNDFVLVLDDYHVLDSTEIDSALSFLIDNQPPQMHLIITTREDPSLPLARLRGRGQLTELRAADLRFTLDEAGGFLNQVMDLKLKTEDIAALETRTEGWIAGLQLAAISMQGTQDASGFIQSFTGSHHFVLDYLVEEVLHQQPESIQTFLLRTSILDRLCGPLCDALLADFAVSGQETLKYIEQANLFLVPLDNERRWYRYHHLFADLLQQRLQQHQEDVAELHSRASLWYEAEGFELEAFQHAAASQDIARAERLLEGDEMPLIFRGIVTPILNWLNGLPVTILDARPALWVWSAHASAFIGQSNVIEQKLQAAEAALQSSVLDDRSRDLVGHIASIRAMQAIPRNQVDILLAESRRALEYLHPDNLPIRMTATWTLGYAYQTQGDRALAIQAYTDTLAISQVTGNFMNALAAATCLGQVQETQNRLNLAAENYRHVLRLVGDPPLPYACEAFIGMARLSYQWNDLDASQQYGQQSAELAQQIENIDTPAVAWIFLARLKLAQGDLAGAVAILAEAEAFVRQRNFLHLMPELADAQIQTLLFQGKLVAAAHLAQTQQRPMSQARVYLAQGDPSAAMAFLEPLYQEAQTKNWADNRLKVTLLQALAQQALGDTEQALHLLAEALAMAAPDGFIRVFVDEKLPMAHLLSIAATRGIMPDYLPRLLAAFDTDQRKLAGDSPRRHAATAQPLLDALSDRELEILQLVAQGLSNREISERLYLALDTVKGHNRRIFAKLQVQRRTEAVARARELNLL